MYNKSLTIVLVLLLIGISLPASAEEKQTLASTEPALQQENQDSTSLQIKKQSAIKKAFQSIENRWNKEKMEGKQSMFSPRVGNIATGSSLAAGVRFGLKYMEASAAYSLRGYQEYEMMIGYNPPREGFILKRHDLMTPFNIPGFENANTVKYATYADLRYHDFPQQDFYGRGGESTEDNWTDYRLQESSYSGVLLVQLNKNFRMGARAGFARPDIGRGTDGNIPNTQMLFSGGSAPGLMKQPDFWRINAGVLMDYRDNSRNPHAGGALGLHLLWMNDNGENLYEFTRYTIDARYFQPLGAESRILAVRMLTSFSDVGQNKAIPFYYLDMLGGSHTLRGFHSQRFQDNNLMHFSTEFRFEAKQWLELAAFYDVGKVFSEPSDFGFQDLESSYGAGVRFKTNSGVLLRLDGARSREGYQVYLSLGSSF